MPSQSPCAIVDEALDRFFDDPAAQPPEAVRLHLQDCARCRQLYRWILERAGTPDPSPESRHAIRQSLLPSLRPVRPIPSPRTLTLAFLLVFACLAVAMIGFTDKMGLHRMSPLQLGLMTGFLAASAVLSSLWLVGQMLPGTYQRVPMIPVLGACGLSLVCAIAAAFPWQPSSAFWAEGRRCSLLEFSIGAPAAVLFWLLARRGAPFPGARFGAAVAGLGGLLGLTVLQYQCMRQEASHLLVWHFGALALLISAGALIGFAVRNWPLMRKETFQS